MDNRLRVIYEKRRPNCSVKSVKIVWKVAASFPLRPVYIGKMTLESPRFETTEQNGGEKQRKWFLQIGREADKQDISLYIRLEESNDDGEEEVLAKVKFAIVDANGKNTAEAGTSAEKYQPGIGWGFCDFVQRRVLLDEQNRLLPNGRLTIVCHLEIFEKGIIEDPDHLWERWIRPDCVLLSSDQKKLQAHKCVLARRSPVLAAMFQQQEGDGMTMSTAGMDAANCCLNIADITGDVLHQMLRFIYRGIAPNLDGMAMELLAAGDKYQIDGLKVLCEHSLALSLNTENACQLLVHAEHHSAGHLKLEAIQFINSHPDEVMKSDGWNVLSNGLIAQLFQRP